MITLQVSNADILKIQSELNLKVGGAKELASAAVLTELANAVFTMSAKSFVKAMNMQAKASPKTYHHMYEWNQVGVDKARLFFLYKDVNSGGKLVIKPGLVQSKTNVPIAKELLQPGRTGKSVSSRYVFKDKASVMESGKPIIYRASKNIPMTENGKLRFVAAGTLIRNYNPGGKQVKGSFEKFYNVWFATKVNDVIRKSGIMDSIDSELARVLNRHNAGPKEVKTAIINLLKQYSKGIDTV
jgi:hypothetical protein